MKTGTCAVVLLSIVAAFASAYGVQNATSSSSNTGEGAQKVPSIALGGTSGSPGDAVVVPLYFNPAEGTKVGRLKVEITFVSANLKFDKVERGIAAELADAEVTSDLKLGKNDKDVETSTVSITISPKDNSELPAGLLAYMNLRISPSGRPASISLRTVAEATEAGTTKKIDKLKVGDATVEVIAPGSEPLTSCFFFTH